MKILVIDPGIKCGLAFLHNRQLFKWETIQGKGKSWEDKTKHVASIILNYSLLFNPKKVFIEFPLSHFRGNLKSVIKLAFLIGRLVEVLEAEIILVPVSAWRGNLPKEIGWQRAERFFKVRGLVNDAGDACSLAMFLVKKGLI